ncbi:hypothetical protein DMN91_006775 [Ooceraea biroi]|uniref:Ig-like domain-containing protein n=2 Tax=Ooceraea biroi TaxID=2015173 RepID=A0A3L8DJW9_OOCBI|nr:uncharacterized protein LOC105279767 [Ooceraea biroi]RLU20168.1 hypothetical protein DMN91_006775 [Ooceraea biroi]
MICISGLTIARYRGFTVIMPVTSRRCLLVSLLLTFGCIRESRQLIIKSMNVPATVKASETDYVILDCDYDLENTSSKGLVVKWFFNNNEVAYQWIYGRHPQAAEPAAKYVDLLYRASDDPYTEYRAMKLNKPGIDLTGEYTCVISTFADERIANASMVVYATEEKFDLTCRKRTIGDKDGVEVTCMAKGLYPQPSLDISVESISEKQATKPIVTLRDDGLYDVLSRMTLLDEDLPEAAIVKCSLSIPRANYNVSRKTIYYAGTAATTSTSTSTTKLQHKTDVQGLDSLESGNGGGDFVNGAAVNLLLLSMHWIVIMML